MASTLPGKWRGIRTTAGVHLQLKGANGEPVLTSEVYENDESLQVALDLVGRTEPVLTEIVDLRGEVDEA
jgi:uncharacterized protein YegP (UPF0339 family)